MANKGEVAVWPPGPYKGLIGQYKGFMPYGPRAMLGNVSGLFTYIVHMTLYAYSPGDQACWGSPKITHARL